MADLPVNATDFFPSLALGPLLETCLVDVVAASCFAPHDFLGLRFKFCEAYRAVSGDFLAIGGCVRGGRR